MENYIKAQQEILRVASQLKPGEVHIFYHHRFVIGSGNTLVAYLHEDDIHIEPIYDKTTNRILVGRVIGRPVNDNDSANDFPVVLGNIREIEVFAFIFSKDILADRRHFSHGDTHTIWIPKKQEDTTNLSIMGSSQYADKPEQCPRLLDSSLSLLSAKIPQSKDEMLAKLNVLFEEAAYKEYDMNEMIDMLKKKYGENAAINYDEYGLRFDYDYTSNEATTFDRFDIYVKKNDTPLKLQAIEKATYLAYILFNDGDGVKNSIPLSFQQTLADIYTKMADKSIKDPDFGGIMSSKIYDPKINGYNRLAITTIAGYRSAINKEINKHIPIKRLAQDFRIEGIKDQPFKVAKSTYELREQIRRLFQVK